MKVEYKISKEKVDVLIKVEIFVPYFCSNLEYRIADIGIKSKEKRKYRFKAHDILNSHIYRNLDIKERESYVKQMFMAYVTEEDIKNAIDFAYSKIKPTLKDVVYWIN